MAKLLARLLGTLLGLACAALPAAAQPAAPGGKFCLRHPNGEFDLLLVRPMPDGSVSFGLSSWQSGANFVVSGIARSAGGSWRFAENLTSRNPAERCEVTLASEAGGYAVATREGARCEDRAGPRAVLRGTLRFAASSRVGDAPGRISPEVVMREPCEAPPPNAPAAGRGRHTPAMSCPSTVAGAPVDGFNLSSGGRVFSQPGTWSVAELGRGQAFRVTCVYAGVLDVHEFRVPATARRCTSVTGRDFRCE